MTVRSKYTLLSGWGTKTLSMRILNFFMNFDSNADEKRTFYELNLNSLTIESE